MIKTLIFDFGDVFINLDKEGALQNALDLFQLDTFESDMLEANLQYEMGKISTAQFIQFYLSKFPYLNELDVIGAWNYILKDFPMYRFDFIKTLSDKNQFKLILLSNTNVLHIDFIKEQFNFFEDFKNCFDKFYLSHEIHLRKPDKKIFEYVLKQNKLKANECLFIDDTNENVKSASNMGFHIWNIDETNEDIINLFEVKKELF